MRRLAETAEGLFLELNCAYEYCRYDTLLHIEQKMSISQSTDVKNCKIHEFYKNLRICMDENYKQFFSCFI